MSWVTPFLGRGENMLECWCSKHVLGVCCNNDALPYQYSGILGPMIFVCIKICFYAFVCPLHFAYRDTNPRELGAIATGYVSTANDGQETGSLSKTRGTHVCKHTIELSFILNWEDKCFRRVEQLNSDLQSVQRAYRNYQRRISDAVSENVWGVVRLEELGASGG